MEETNYYKALQVDRDAEPEVIKAAYRALSRKYHPDGTHPSAQRMMRLNDAYAVLNDPTARARHNDELERWGFSPGKPPSQPATSPRMRYQEDAAAEPPRQRRRYRPMRAGVMTQIVVISVCALAFLASGILTPKPPAPTPTPTAIPRSFLTSATQLRAGFEEDGFVFDTEISRAGLPVTRGLESSNGITVYIQDIGDVIQYASVLLDVNAAVNYQIESDQTLALGRLLDASYGTLSSHSNAANWIAGRRHEPDSTDTWVYDGWEIRIWTLPDGQIGIAFQPESH